MVLWVLSTHRQSEVVRRRIQDSWELPGTSKVTHIHQALHLLRHDLATLMQTITDWKSRDHVYEYACSIKAQPGTNLDAFIKNSVWNAHAGAMLFCYVMQSPQRGYGGTYVCTTVDPYTPPQQAFIYQHEP